MAIYTLAPDQIIAQMWPNGVQGVPHMATVSSSIWHNAELQYHAIIVVCLFTPLSASTIHAA